MHCSPRGVNVRPLTSEVVRVAQKNSMAMNEPLSTMDIYICQWHTRISDDFVIAQAYPSTCLEGSRVKGYCWEFVQKSQQNLASTFRLGHIKDGEIVCSFEKIVCNNINIKIISKNKKGERNLVRLIRGLFYSEYICYVCPHYSCMWMEINAPLIRQRYTGTVTRYTGTRNCGITNSRASRQIRTQKREKGFKW